MKTKLFAAVLAAVMILLMAAPAYAQGPEGDPTPTPDWAEQLRSTVIPEIREAQDALATATPVPPTATPLPPTATPVPAVPIQVPPAGPVEREAEPQGPAQPQQPARPERPGMADRIFGGIAGFFGRRVIDPVDNFITRFKWVLIAIVVLIVIGILSWFFRGIQWLVWAISQLRHVWTLLRWLATAGGALIRIISEARARRPERRRPDDYELIPPPPLAPTRTRVMGPEEYGDLDLEMPKGLWPRRPRTGVIDEDDLPAWLRRGIGRDDEKRTPQDQDPPGWFNEEQKRQWWELVRLGWLDSMSYVELVEHVKDQTPAEPPIVTFGDDEEGDDGPPIVTFG